MGPGMASGCTAVLGDNRSRMATGMDGSSEVQQETRAVEEVKGLHCMGIG